MKQFLESPNLLETIKAETEKISNDARQLVDGLSEEQLNWKPDPERWSIAQCLDHVALANAKFGPYLSGAIARGHEKRPISGAIAYKPTLVGGWLARQLVPEATKKMSAPRIFRPSEASAIQNALEQFLQQQQELLRFVADAEGVDYNKTKLRSPVTSLMRYSLADAFVITVVHGQRHLAQARRLRETSGFPVH